MTPDLLTRVATAMAAADGNTWSSPDALMAVYGDLARAAVGVVVEAAAEVCEMERDGYLDHMEGADSPEFELNSGAESALDRMALLIRNLIPKDPA